MIIRKLSGNELKRELLQALDWGIPRMWREDIFIREVTNIEFIDDNKAIITYRFADLYQKELGNNEQFEVKFLADENTNIYRENLLDKQSKISNLKTEEYNPEWIGIYLEQSTIDDEMPLIKDLDI